MVCILWTIEQSPELPLTYHTIAAGNEYMNSPESGASQKIL